MPTETAGESQRLKCLAMRCIVAAMAEPSTPFNIPAIADATGLTEEVISEALNSDECAELLNETCVQHIQLALTRGIRIATSIMIHSEKEDTQLAAFRSLTTFARDMSKRLQNTDSASGEQEVLKLLEKLDTPNTRPRRLNLDEDDSASRPRDLRTPTEGNGNQGRPGPS